MPNFRPQPREDSVSMASEGKVSDLLDIGTCQWDIGKLHSLFNSETISAILQVRLPHQLRRDELIWTLTGSGSFTVKSMY